MAGGGDRYQTPIALWKLHRQALAGVIKGDMREKSMEGDTSARTPSRPPFSFHGGHDDRELYFPDRFPPSSALQEFGGLGSRRWGPWKASEGISSCVSPYLSDGKAHCNPNW